MNNIFISSSFRDMQAERDMLRYIVLPEINVFLRRNYGQDTNIIDLRWGIDTSSESEEAISKTIIQTCLLEIENCKPFMIVLLGDRYGSIADKTLVAQLCELDDSFENPHDDIGITELEIRKGISLMSEGKMNCLFYFRDMDYSVVPTEKRDVFFDEGTGSDKPAKLKALKEDIISICPQRCKHYPAQWNQEKDSVDGLQVLADMIVNDLKMLIANELGSPKAISFMGTVLRSEEAYVHAKEKLFIGRRKELDSIKEFLEDGSDQILFIRGQAGCGKSSLVCNLPKYYGEKYDFLTVFCGQGSLCDTANGIMRNVIYKLRRRLNMDNVDLFNSFYSDEQLFEEMDSLVKEYTFAVKKKLVIVYDAIDQLSSSLHTKNFYYLPKELSQIKCILTMPSDYQVCYDALLFNRIRSLEMSSPSSDELGLFVQNVWKLYGKYSVATKVKEELLAKKHSDNYLYLHLLMVRLSYLGKEVFDTPENNEQYIRNTIIDIIRNFPEDMENAVLEMLSTISRYFRKNYLFELVSLIACSPSGLRVLDLQDLCSTQWNGAEFSLIMRVLDPFVFERFDHRIDFSHRLFKGIAKRINGCNSAPMVNKLFAYALSLPNDDMRKPEYAVNSLTAIANGDAFYKYCYQLIKDTNNTSSIAWELASAIHINRSIIEILSNAFPINESSIDLLEFIMHDVGKYLSPSEGSVSFLSSVSSKFYNYFIKHPDCFETLSAKAISVLVQFEQWHLKTITDYNNSVEPEAILFYALRHWKMTNEPASLLLYCELLSSYGRVYEAGELLEAHSNSQKPEVLILKAKVNVKRAEKAYPPMPICFSNEGDRLINEACDSITQAFEKISRAKDNNESISITEDDCRFIYSELLLSIGRIFMRIQNTEGAAREWIDYSGKAEFYSRAELYFATAKEQCKLATGKRQTGDKTKGLLLQIIKEEVTILHFFPNICSVSDCEPRGFDTLDSDFTLISDFLKDNLREAVSPRESAKLLSSLVLLYSDYLGVKIDVVNPYEDVYSEFAYSVDSMNTLYDRLSKWDLLFNHGMDIVRRLNSYSPTIALQRDFVEMLYSRIQLLNFYDPWSRESIEAYWKNNRANPNSPTFKERRSKDKADIYREQLRLAIEASETLYLLQKSNRRGYLSYYLLVFKKVLKCFTMHTFEKFDDKSFATFKLMLEQYCNTICDIIDNGRKEEVLILLYVSFFGLSCEGLSDILLDLTEKEEEYPLQKDVLLIVNRTISLINDAKSKHEGEYRRLDYYGSFGEDFFAKWCRVVL